MEKVKNCRLLSSNHGQAKALVQIPLTKHLTKWTFYLSLVNQPHCVTWKGSSLKWMQRHQNKKKTKPAYFSATGQCTVWVTMHYFELKCMCITARHVQFVTFYSGNSYNLLRNLDPEWIKDIMNFPKINRSRCELPKLIWIYFTIEVYGQNVQPNAHAQEICR